MIAATIVPVENLTKENQVVSFSICWRMGFYTFVIAR